jgi:peptidoglycan/xylan/chitin deacetylase (PgdA/CDA1 family)
VRVFAPAWAALLAGVLVLGCGSTTGHRHVAHSPAPTPTRSPAPRRSHPAAPRRARGHYRGAVPILMYHVLGTPRPGTPNGELWVPPRRFRAQLDRLARAGYDGVTLTQVWRAWHGGPGLPRHPVVVSFDDGYDDQYRVAGPLLRRLGWPGVLNLEVHNLHVAGGLSAREVRTLLAGGWELAAHTLTHPDLTTVDAGRLRREVAGSRAVLRREFGVPVAFFCYPGGRYDAAAEAAVRAAGYRGATTTAPGLAAPGGDRFALPRLRVLPETTPAMLLAAVR